MNCTKCGKKVQDTDLFCTRCGNPLKQNESEPQKAPANKSVNTQASLPPANPLFKLAVIALSVLLVCILLISLTGKNRGKEEIPDQEIDPEWEAQWEEQYGYPEPDEADSSRIHGVDLSQYDNHGEWSDGKMWVHKIDSGYDHNDGYYGYINTEGELIGTWHSDQEWLQPSDYSMGFTTVCTAIDYGTNYAVLVYDVIDETGESLGYFVAHSEGFYSPEERYKRYVKDGFGDWATFNENGILIYTQKTQYLNDYPKPLSLLQVTDEGTVREVTIQRSTQETLNPKCFESDFTNGYMLYYDCSYYVPDSTQYMDVFYIDEDGNTALYLSNFEYQIFEARPIENGVAEIVFRGRDGNRYLLSMDLSGKWLTEPELIP